MAAVYYAGRRPPTIESHKLQSMRGRADRAVIVVAVLALHCGFLVWFTLESTVRPARQRSEPEAWLTWLDLTSARDPQSTPGANNSTRPSLVAIPRVDDSRPPLAASASAPIESAPSDPAPIDASPPAAAIDWQREVAASANRALEEDRVARRQARAFEPRRTPGLAEPPATPRPAPHFRWSEAHTKRLQRDEYGNTILRLNERCVIVNFLLPACAIGEIPSYGDLFKDMNRAPEFGDWNDDSATRRDNMDP